MCTTLIEVVYEELRETYSCTLRHNSITQFLEINVGFGYVLKVVHEEHEKFHQFTIVSNRGSKPVYIICPIDEKGGSDIVPLYRFIDDFSNLL
jgi:hypothetical protein